MAQAALKISLVEAGRLHNSLMFKPKPCSACGAQFIPRSTKSRTCSPECAIAEKATIDRRTDCWNVPPTPGLNYGHISWGRQDYAHRFSYSHLNGPIPKGQFVRHKCDTPTCVNPDHLELGSHNDNMRDMVERGRSGAGEKNSCAKLTAVEVVAIYKSDEPRSVLAKRYGISKANVRSIKVGNSWAKVTGANQ